MRWFILLLVVPSLAGCAGLDRFWDDVTRPDLDVQRTPIEEGGWNTDPRFAVVVSEPEPVSVVIEATASDGRTLRAEGLSTIDVPVELVLEDGTWTVTYTVQGHRWETFDDVRVDATPPSLDGLVRVGDAQGGVYVLGDGVQVPADAELEVRDADGALLARSLPLRVDGLGTGLHVYHVVVRDAAGNEQAYVVQVRAGDAKALPEGQWTFGIVARYSNEARLWDLSDMTAYDTPQQAAAATGGAWLGAGFGVTPDDPAVQAVVDQTQGTTTMEIAWNLYRWIYDELEYDDERLASTTLMLPRHVLEDTEDPDAEAQPDQDAGDDGLADDGRGNGVAGGVCRDLAATYVSLLRAAGVPARLVSGYLAGSVDGFHAWVEFYAGDVAGNPSPWVPVDVSPIDGLWNDDRRGDGVPDGLETAMQSFAVALPEYLALREVPSPEPAGWSTALSTRYSYPEHLGPPDVRFEKDVEVQGSQESARLCFDADTLARTIAANCSGTFFDDFVVFSERIIDYGVHVVSAEPGTTITAGLALPFMDAAAPDDVSFLVYGKSYREDAAAGTVEATFEA